MQVPHDAFIVVADGQKMLLLRNEGDEQYLNLQVDRKLCPDETATASTEDSHALLKDEDHFAAEVADLLRQETQAHALGTLIVAAPPRTLGALRRHYHRDVQAIIAGEIGKDLTGHTVPRIEEALLNAR